MPRPRKSRRVCYFPQTLSFAPTETTSKEPVILTVDEYETIRLIDKEGLSQEQCSSFMKVARTTVQQVYAAARRKLAETLVDGRPLRIEGGDYELCCGDNASCGYGGCFKQEYHQQYEKPKGEHGMRVAVTYENGEIFQHFGHTESFKIYNIEDGKITSSEILSTNGSGHGALAEMLKALNAEVLICGGIGAGAQKALADAGIKLYGGASGNADKAVEAFLENSLEFDPNVKCNHHSHSDGEAHTCGKHTCH